MLLLQYYSYISLFNLVNGLVVVFMSERFYLYIILSYNKTCTLLYCYFDVRSLVVSLAVVVFPLVLHSKYKQTGGRKKGEKNNKRRKRLEAKQEGRTSIPRWEKVIKLKKSLRSPEQNILVATKQRRVLNSLRHSKNQYTMNNSQKYKLNYLE